MHGHNGTTDIVVGRVGTVPDKPSGDNLVAGAAQVRREGGGRSRGEEKHAPPVPRPLLLGLL